MSANSTIKNDKSIDDSNTEVISQLQLFPESGEHTLPAVKRVRRLLDREEDLLQDDLQQDNLLQADMLPADLLQAAGSQDGLSALSADEPGSGSAEAILLAQADPNSPPAASGAPPVASGVTVAGTSIAPGLIVGALALGIAAAASGGDDDAPAPATPTVIVSNGGGAAAQVSVAENTVTVATVVGTADAGETLTYSIIGGADAAKFTINASTGLLTFVVAPNFDAPTDAGSDNIYAVTVQVSDGTTVDNQAIEVTVTNLNDNAPAISSGATGSVDENAAISTVVYTTVATDADGNALSYSLSGTDAAAFDISALGVVTLKVSANFESKSSYSFNVIASDGTLSDTQAVTISVNNLNDNAPVISSGATANVDENALISTAVYTTVATDADGNALSFSLGGTDAAAFDISALGVVTLKVPADFETKSSYSIDVIASDGTLSDTQAVTISVNNLNDNAPVISSGATANVDENALISTAVYTTVATDADGNALSFSLGGTDAAAFDISALGVVTLKASANFETQSSYSIDVIASDGTLSDTQAVMITVNDINEAPVMTSGATGSVDENALISTVVYASAATDVDGDAVSFSLGGTDAAAFDISGTGEVTLKVSADFEVKSSYSIDVIASDGSLSDTEAVTISVNNLNDNNPVITSGGAGSIDENALVSTAAYTTVATDADATALIYSLGGADAGDFDISALGVVTLKVPADFESQSSYSIDVIASDGATSDTEAVTITVNDVNDAPEITSGATGSVDENALISTVVYSSAATDDDGDAVSFSLGGADAAAFDISGAGDVTLKVSADFETKSTYSIDVIASDGGLSDTEAVTISINNLNDNAPVITSGASGSIDENAVIGTAAYTSAATDADGSALGYSLGGADAADFDISVLGVVTLKVPADFEMKASYGIDVIASDGVMSDTQAVTITVNNLNDNAPVITSGVAGNVDENSPINTVLYTATATDADGNPLSYSLGGADAAAFSVNSGVVTLNSSANFEVKSSYNINVIASDGSLSDSQAVTITINDINDAPLITSGATGSVDENALISTAVYTSAASDDDGDAVSFSLGGTDAAAFDISGLGVVTLKAPADFEAKSSYSIDVIAGDGTLTDTEAVTITINDVDEIPPTLLSSSPADNGTGVAAGGNIVLNFDDDMASGAGNIVISNGTDSRVIPIGDAQIVISGSTVTINPVGDLIGDGSTYNVQMAAGVLTDTDGNAFAGITDGTTLNFSTLDTMVVAPSAPNLDTGSDLGSSSTDDLTKDNTPTVSGSGAEAGATVTLYDTDGSTVLGSGVANMIGLWSITSSTLAQGAHSLTVKQTDLAANVSVASSALVVTIDTSRPTVNGASFVGGTSVITLDFSEAVLGTTGAMALVKNPSSDNNYNGTAMTLNSVVNADADTLTLTTDTTQSGTDFVRIRFDADSLNAVSDLAGNTVSSREVYAGGNGNNIIDLSNYGSSYLQILRGNGGNDELTGTSAADTLIDGGGGDILAGGRGTDTLRLVENGTTRPYARDTVSINLGESTVNGWDVVGGSPTEPVGTGFDISSTTAADHDVLSLNSNLIAANVTNVDGADSAAIARHSIVSGIITFLDASANAILINEANMANANAYLSANISTSGTTVAYRFDGDSSGSVDSLVVFQNNGTIPLAGGFVVPDTVVVLADLIGIGSATLGTTAGANVVHLVDTMPPEPIGFALTSNGVALNFAEIAFFPGTLTNVALSLELNGITAMSITGGSGDGTTALTVETSTTLAASDWVLLNYTGADVTDALRDASGNLLIGDEDPGYGGSAEGSNSNNTIDLSNAIAFSASGGYELNAAGGNDTLIGSGADDSLEGGTGADLMTGGAGNDDFNFGQGDSPVGVVNLNAGGTNGVLGNGDTFSFAGGVDRITDFASGEGFNLSSAQEDISGLAGAGWMGSQSETPATSVQPTNGLATDQGFFLTQGNYNSINGLFTVDSTITGLDTLVVYDGDSSAAVTQTGIVLSGVTLAQLNAFAGNNWISHI